MMENSTETCPIIMVGTRRSGSNLLRVMLNQLDGITAPHPPHILQVFSPLMARYGDLNEDNNFFELINDVCGLVEKNIVPWEAMPFDRKLLINRASVYPRSLEAVFFSVYDIYTKMTHNSRWCCKSLSNVHHIESIEKQEVLPQYIHIYRDGRDVALSFQKTPVGHKHYYHIAAQWHEEQRLALELKNRVGEERYIGIKYEDLMQNTRAVLHKLCLFLHVPFSEKMLSFFDSRESSKTASSGAMWENLTKPIMHQNIGKFRHQMKEKDIHLFESVAGDMLLHLGYELVALNTKTALHISVQDISEFDKENDYQKQLFQQQIRTQENHLRAKREEFIKTLQEAYV